MDVAAPLPPTNSDSDRAEKTCYVALDCGDSAREAESTSGHGRIIMRAGDVHGDHVRAGGRDGRPVDAGNRAGLGGDVGLCCFHDERGEDGGFEMNLWPSFVGSLNLLIYNKEIWQAIDEAEQYGAVMEGLWTK